jgi:hypothetical protein
MYSISHMVCTDLSHANLDEEDAGLLMRALLKCVSPVFDTAVHRSFFTNHQYDDLCYPSSFHNLVYSRDEVFRS